jgi:hypothetical protein
MWRPHDPIPVEPTFDEFVRSVGGKRVSDLLPKNPNFENADYLFESDDIVAKLKEITTEFSKANGFFEKHYGIVREFRKRNLISWGDLVRGGPFPPEYHLEYIRLFRPTIQRILKKANRQIKSSKEALKRRDSQGLLIIVNDGFTSVSPFKVRALISDSLVSSYKSISAFIYVTVNTYVELRDSDYAHLIWAAVYAPDTPDSLVDFVDNLGRKWRSFLEGKIGPFDVNSETQNRDILMGSSAIRRRLR